MLEAIDVAHRRLADILKARSGSTRPDKLHVPSTENFDAGYTYVRFEHGEYVYRANERGKILFEKRTNSLPEFIQLIFRDVTSSAAREEARNERSSGYFERGLDQRRAWFPRWVDIATQFDPELGSLVQAEVDQILKGFPYRDR